MQLKKFNQYIKEDYSSEYNIEDRPVSDGDDLTTQDDESKELPSEVELDGEIEGEADGEVEIDIIGELSKLDSSILQKIAMGEIDAVSLAKEILENGIDNEETTDLEDDLADELEDSEDSDDDNDFEEDMDDDTEHKMPFSLGESMTFKNFKKRK